MCRSSAKLCPPCPSRYILSCISHSYVQTRFMRLFREIDVLARNVLELFDCLLDLTLKQSLRLDVEAARLMCLTYTAAAGEGLYAHCSILAHTTAGSGYPLIFAVFSIYLIIGSKCGPNNSRISIELRSVLTKI